MIENININESKTQQNWIKLHVTVKQNFYKSFRTQYRLHLHCLLWIPVYTCELTIKTSFPYNTKQAIEREISPSNNATLSQSELIWTFFISYNTHEPCFALWEQKTLEFECTFQCLNFEKDMATILIVTNKIISMTKLVRRPTQKTCLFFTF